MNPQQMPVFERTLSISLHRDLTNGLWFVEQLDLRYGPVRNHMNFSEKLELTEAFCTDFTMKLLDHLPVTISQQILTLSGKVINLGNFAASNIRILAQAAQLGTQRVIVRFTEVTGRVFQFLAAPLRPEDPADIGQPQSPISFVECQSPANQDDALYPHQCDLISITHQARYEGGTPKANDILKTTPALTTC